MHIGAVCKLKLITKLQEAYSVLANNGVGKHELEKVNDMCNKINTSHQEAVSARTIVRTTLHLREKFVAAANHMSKLISSILRLKFNCKILINTTSQSPN